MESELSLLMVDVQLSRKGTNTMRNLSDSNPKISGTTLIYTTVVTLFSRRDSGNYSCEATIRPHPNLEQPSSFYLHGTGKLVSNQTQVTTGSHYFKCILIHCVSIYDYCVSEVQQLSLSFSFPRHIYQHFFFQIEQPDQGPWECFPPIDIAIHKQICFSQGCSYCQKAVLSTQTAIFSSLTLEMETVELCSVTLTSRSVATTAIKLLEPWDSGFTPMDQMLEHGAVEKTSMLTEDPVLCA